MVLFILFVLIYGLMNTQLFCGNSPFLGNEAYHAWFLLNTVMQWKVSSFENTFLVWLFLLAITF